MCSVAVLLEFAATGATNVSIADDVNPVHRPIPVKKWYVNLQKTGSRFQPGETDVQTKEQRAKLLAQMSQDQNGIIIEFLAPVKQVKWKEGIATVTIGPMLKLPNTTSPNHPLKVRWTPTFDVTMSQEDAVAIKPGMRFEFTGEIEFHPNRYGAVGSATESQQLFTIQNVDLGGLPLGTFTSRRYSLRLNRKPITGKWTEASVEDSG